MFRSKWQRATAMVLTAATAVALSGFDAAAEDAPTTQPNLGSAPIASSTNNPSAPDLRAVQQTLGQLAAEASQGGHCRQLVALLARSNRDAIGDIDPVTWADVDAEVNRFRQTWQGQFGVGFDLNDKEAFVFAEPNVRMLRGTDREAVLAEARKVAKDGAVRAEIDAAPSGAAPTVGKAVVMMAAEGSAKPLTLFVISEGRDKENQPAWRVETPSGVSARSLHDSLLHHLKTMNDSRASWPSNIDQAYSFVAHHLLSAVAEKPVALSQQTAGAPAALPSAQTITPAAPR